MKDYSTFQYQSDFDQETIETLLGLKHSFDPEISVYQKKKLQKNKTTDSGLKRYNTGDFKVDGGSTKHTFSEWFEAGDIEDSRDLKRQRSKASDTSKVDRAGSASTSTDVGIEILEFTDNTEAAVEKLECVEIFSIKEVTDNSQKVRNNQPRKTIKKLLFGGAAKPTSDRSVSENSDISKGMLIEIFQKVTGTKLSKHVLANITPAFGDKESDFFAVGRPEVVGSSRLQLRHVVPYSFIVKIIQKQVEKELNPKELVASLINFVVRLIPEQKGIIVSDKMLDGPFKKVADQIVSNASREILSVAGEKSFMVSPIKASRILDDKFFDTPSKTKIATVTEGYDKHHRLFIWKTLMNILDYYSHGPSTQIIYAENLARLILTIFNLRDGAAYPDEGNTQSYEIRLYKSKALCKAGSKDYQIVTSYELADKLSKGSEKYISEHIRIVENQGYMVKLASANLNILNNYIGLKDAEGISMELKTDKLIDYLATYNKLTVGKYIKLTNEIADPYEDPLLSLYNKDINIENFEVIYAYHIAKQLYYVFDYKPLEQHVLKYVARRSTVDNKISVFKGAKTETCKKYAIVDGINYRDEQVNSAKGYNEKIVFRNMEFTTESEIDHGIEKAPPVSVLAKKIVEHVMISLLPFEALRETKYLAQILDAFAMLVRRDFKCSDTEALNFEIKLNSDKYDIKDFLLPGGDSIDSVGYLDARDIYNEYLAGNIESPKDDF